MFVDFLQVANAPSLRCGRFLRYVAPVTLFSLAFNASKFLESSIDYVEVNATNADDPPKYETHVLVNEMRTDPWYSLYVNWSRLVVLGLVPFVLLVFFNWKIFNVGLASTTYWTLQSQGFKVQRKIGKFCGKTGAKISRGLQNDLFCIVDLVAMKFYHQEWNEKIMGEISMIIYLFPLQKSRTFWPEGTRCPREVKKVSLSGGNL